MSKDLVINVTYNGDDSFKDNFFQIPYDIVWADLEAMLKAHFDCDRLSVTYLDEDNDEVSIGSQDELFEAFRFAMKKMDTLYLKVMPMDRGASVFRMFDDTVVENDDDIVDGPIPRQTDNNANNLEPEEPVPSPGSHFAIPMPDLDRAKVEKKESATEYEEINDTEHDGKEEIVDKSPDGQEIGAVPRDRQLSVDTVNEQLSYQEFVSFMTKLKKDLRTEIVRDVTKKTVKQVLKGLDGAVIESLQSTQTSQAGSMSASAARTVPKDAHPIYSHEGVYCDVCNKIIIGARYKCGNCLDFDLCETCEAKPNLHNPEHVFVKLRIPCRRVGVSSSGEQRPLLKSIIYKSHEKRSSKLVVPIPTENAAENEINFRLEGKMKDIFARNEGKRKKEMAKLKKKEEKLKRKMEQLSESSLKRERLELLNDKSAVRYDFYKVMMGAKFLYDVSVPDSTKMQSGTKFTKTWRMKNDGDGPWSESTKLKLKWGNIPTPHKEVDVPHLKPGEEGNISVDFVSLGEPGYYQSHWKLYEHGMEFGHRIWCTIVVVPRETLEPTTSESDSLKVVVDASQKSETGQVLEGVTIESMVKEGIEITFRSTDEEHLREVSVRRDSESDTQSVNTQDSIAVNVDDTEQELAQNNGFQEVIKNDGKQEDEKDDGKQEEAKNDGNQEEAKDDGKQEVEIDRQYEHVDAEEDVKDEGSDTCEGFVVYAKHKDTDDLVEVQKQDDKKEKEADTQLEADLTSAVARLTLEGENREQIPLVSQTATPNNTPFDVTPLKTPNPEPEDDGTEDKDHVEIDMKRISNSSSVELVLPSENEELQDEHVEQYIKTRLASLELKPDIDLESVSSYSEDDDEDDDSSLSDSDYIIVPLPDCFNISKPMNQSQTLSSYSNSVVDRDFSLDDNHNSLSQRSSRAVSVDEILTTSGVIEQRPLSPTPPDSQGQPDTMAETGCSPNPEMSESAESYHMPDVDLPKVKEAEAEAEAVNIVTEQPSGVSSLPLPVGGDDGVSSPTIDEPQGGADSIHGASGAASGENLDSQTAPSMQSGETTPDSTDAKEPLSASAQMPENVNYVKVDGQKHKQQKQQKSVDFAPEFANQLVATAVNAAGQAYITAKAVFRTWQDKQTEKETRKSKSKTPMTGWKPASTQYAPPKEEEYTVPKSNWVPDKEEYTPPRSDWKPETPTWKPKEPEFKLPESNYKPPEPSYRPQQSNWRPPTESETTPKKQWTPPTREYGPMGKLIDMGFVDRERNRELLQKHDNDVQLVIQDLLSLSQL